MIRLKFCWIVLASSMIRCLDCGVSTANVLGSGSIDWGSQLLQPCQPDDSCMDRCVKEFVPPTPTSDVTLEHFNCFCDPDCRIFGDCCWDYDAECGVPDSPQPKQSQDKVEANTRAKDADAARHDESLECVVVDQFSKGSYWMVTRCHSDWRDEEVMRRCHEADALELDIGLPVLGETGWTYRNAFCAQCNFVKEFHYWTIKAQCVRSAPPEVLSGDPEMFSYYVKHFCTLELVQDLTFNSSDVAREGTGEDTKHSISAWRKSLRSCVKEMIDSCPESYPHEDIAQLCGRYQSIVVANDDDPQKLILFKNPVCAYCHGYKLRSLEPHVEPSLTMRAQKSKRTSADLKDDEYTLMCPVWMLAMNYDTKFWQIDTRSKSTKLLPAFSKNYKTSSWEPPSFSVLMRFQDADITYTDGSSGDVNIPPQAECSVNEIYDPFLGVCREVMCSDGMVFTDTGCIPGDNELNNSLEPSSDSALTVTITIVFPSGNNTDTTADDVVTDVVNTFEHTLNVSAEMVTLVSNSSAASHSTIDNNTESLSVTFVILHEGNYTNDQLIQIVEDIGDAVHFNELVMEVDFYTMVVVETSDPSTLLVCDDDTEKLQYTSDQYQLSEFNATRMLYINITDSYYSEDEFQMLDWTITISEDGIETSHLTESRVLVCAQNSSLIAPTITPCNLFLPLNSSEYIALENGSLYLEDREMMVSPDEVITFQDGYAVCIDGYTQFPTQTKESELLEPKTADIVVSWITFGLSIVSLISLLFTFLTYSIFSELRSISGWNIMNLTVALFAALLLFMVGSSMTDPPEACTAIAIILHYLYLSTFFWNNVMAFDVWLTFGKGMKQTYRRSQLNIPSTVGRVTQIRRLLIKYMLYAWGMPAIIVVICLVIEFACPQLHFGYQYDPQVMICWISNSLSNILAFGLPLALILIINAVFFTLSIIAIKRVALRKRRHGNTKAQNAKKVKPSDTLPRTPDSGEDTDVFTFPDPLDKPPLSPQSPLPAGNPPRRISVISLKFNKASPDKPPQSLRQSDIPAGKTARRISVASLVFNKPFLDKSPLSPQSSLAGGKQRRVSVVSLKLNKPSLGPSASVNVLLYIKMSTVMGFTWAIGFCSALFPDIDPLRYIFEISVPLQGVFILFAFICKKRILNLYKKKIGCCRKPKKSAADLPSKSCNKPLPRKSSHALGDERRIGRAKTAERLLWKLSIIRESPLSRSRLKSTSSFDSVMSCESGIQTPLPPQPVRGYKNHGFVRNSPEDSFSSADSSQSDFL